MAGNDAGDELPGRRYVSPAATFLLLAAFAAAACIALYAIWAFWPSEAGTSEEIADKKTVHFFGEEWTVTRESLFFVMVAVAGALGGMVHVLRSLSWYVGNRLLRRSWVPFYVLRPIIGAAMATLLYFVIRAGFFSPSASTTEASPYGFAAVAGLAGLFTDQALEKLKKVAEELFEEPPQGKDTVTAEPEVEVAPPQERTRTEALLAGTVNPKGRETSYRFEWGETTDYGQWEPAELAAAGAGLAPRPVTARISGLEQDKEYHYRLVAVSDAGMAYSSDQVVGPAQ